MEEDLAGDGGVDQVAQAVAFAFHEAGDLLELAPVGAEHFSAGSVGKELGGQPLGSSLFGRAGLF